MPDVTMYVPHNAEIIGGSKSGKCVIRGWFKGRWEYLYDVWIDDEGRMNFTH